MTGRLKAVVLAAVAAGVLFVAVAGYTLLSIFTQTASQSPYSNSCDTQEPSTVIGAGFGSTVMQGPVGNGVNVAARAAVRAGWTGEDAVVAVAVAGAESGYDRNAANDHSSARGMWQTMMSYHAAKYNGAPWNDPYANARVAHQIWADANGWNPWTTYTSGAYQTHMVEARRAVDAITKRAQAPITNAVPATTGGTVVDNQSHMQPVAITAARFIRDHWRFNGTIGGWAPGTGHITNSKHYVGLALDVMIPVNTESDAIAAYFAGPGYGPFHVDNVIHNRMIYNKARGWHPYTGTSPHTDHVHIDFISGPEGGFTAPNPFTPLTSVLSADCSDPAVAPTGGGKAVFPLPRGSGYVNNNNYGNGGSLWAHGHTGNDYSVACGTPVLAVTDGTIQIETGSGWSWAGRWLVKVHTGAHTVSTWYAHMQALNVTDGAKVTAGQKIGEVGQLGNATGCHLHLEVHPHDGTIYADGVDPVPWLAAHIGKPVGAQPAATRGGLNIASLNTLGASHTSSSGKHPGMASGPARVGGVVRLLDAHGVTVAGLQEFQRSQANAFQAAAGGTYARWSPPGDSENSVVWRRDTITLIDAATIAVPYFDGHTRRMPLLHLRYGPTGGDFYLLNVHNPADTRRYPRQAHWRALAVARETAAAKRVAATGRPVIVTGDMNDRTGVCRAFTTAGLTPAPGGCSTYTGVDWVFGAGATFRGWTVDRSPLVRATTDHPIVIATVH